LEPDLVRTSVGKWCVEQIFNDIIR
jgi:hypothetical protein